MTRFPSICLLLVAVGVVASCGPTGEVPEATPTPAVAATAPSAPEGPPLFIDVTAAAGLDFLHHPVRTEIIAQGAGVIVFDYDGDGLDDIYLPDSSGPNALFRNRGDGSFRDTAAAAGVDDPLGRGNGGCAADFDNDGDQDLYVTNYGPSRLFVNGGDGAFDDQTAGAGLADHDSTFRSTGCAWGDFDRDGLLDLVVVRHLHERELRMFQAEGFTNAVRSLALYRNDGGGTFISRTWYLGDTSLPGSADDIGNLWGAGFQPGWLDYDNDGDLDLYVVNDYGPQVTPNVLWRNDGPGAGDAWSFVDVSAGSGAGVSMYGMGLAVGDYDGDGFFDMFVTNIGANVLLRNGGEGRPFADVAADAGVAGGPVGDQERIAWGAVFFDYDNDADEDLYVVSGYIKQDPRQPDPPPEQQRQPNLLLRNDGDGTFAEVSRGSGADDPGIGRGGVFLDFNDDGCLDLLVANLGQRASLLQNACDSGNSWLVVRPVGSSSNRDGIGTRITVVAGGTSQMREISSGRGAMGQSTRAAHFGMGRAATADLVLVRWPSGQVQTLTDVAANQRITVTEPR